MILRIVTALALLLSACNIDQQHDLEYLRAFVVRTGNYVPCKNAGFDDAMNVDCETILRLKQEEQWRIEREKREAHMKKYDDQTRE